MKYFILILAVITLLYAASFSKDDSIKHKTYPENSKSAYFAGGCFWGVEYHFEKQIGVLDAISGYMGGTVENPDYYGVVRGNTGHLESVRVVYDPSKTSFEKLAKLFFEIHDMEQTNGQGPDIGSQYLSAIFYNDEKEKQTAQELIEILTQKGYKVATSLKKADKFYSAEGYHQDYYQRKGSLPYCHVYKKIFD
ncbi:MAG: peptide-methionine (S)-S-oxide reductase [Arcobacter sp.]|uniref:peptide-methionine (S)-S-oxide reductase MsrA n=1 Tax=uncultured Arcobacter sp. TaxID=165434 RepID=UPI000CBC0CC0|nr:peptide-methionine (S)-S-oxide reductase MsrA [uncultured Arcobacter sp.]PLY09093.1 MAG: peptide-methionine (S)-S-oxide reductase [Arcobacter sp.]